MKLYDADFAPSPRRVRIFLAEKGIEIPTVKVDLRNREQLGEEFHKVNPWCTVPALELDDGTRLSEIPVISLYFEQLHPEPPLIGTDAKDRALVMMWDRHMEQDGVAAVAEAFRNSHPAFKDRALTGPHDVAQIPELAERGRKRYGWYLEALDRRLADAEFVAGERYTIADITALAAVDFARAVKVGDIDGHANVQRWYDKVSSRPSAKA
ncbi:MAG TPA: glutathione S-transferase [Gammaproteobacteria bacterium]|nr:glutathione S-transferase [Gammaproteobacteria bacterium]